MRAKTVTKNYQITEFYLKYYYKVFQYLLMLHVYCPNLNTVYVNVKLRRLDKKAHQLTVLYYNKFLY